MLGFFSLSHPVKFECIIKCLHYAHRGQPSLLWIYSRTIPIVLWCDWRKNQQQQVAHFLIASIYEHTPTHQPHAFQSIRVRYKILQVFYEFAAVLCVSDGYVCEKSSTLPHIYIYIYIASNPGDRTLITSCGFVHLALAMLIRETAHVVGVLVRSSSPAALIRRKWYSKPNYIHIRYIYVLFFLAAMLLWNDLFAMLLRAAA